jgi:hypothetical protein
MFAAFLRHGSNTVLLALAAGLAVAFAFGLPAPSPLAMVAGALVFFGSEYTTHRFLLHAPPLRRPFLLSLQHRLHYDHHLRPSELDLLFLPLWFALPVVALYVAVAFALTHAWGATFSALFGAVAGLLYYEWVHYVAHTPFVPVTPFGRWIKKYHLWHHFKNERLWFGVTNPALDVLVRTYRRVEDAERSASTRVLH